jgi:transcriptional regulator with XRE-family HTH domain
MAPGDTPAVARRAVRLAIRDARTAQHLTQTDVAEAMEWSLSKVMRIESGEVTISQNDLRPLLLFLKVRDKAKVDELIQAAKASKQRRQWWDQPKFAGMLTPAMKQWFSYEAEATSMRIFCAAHFPGFLQTSEFARIMLSFYEDELSPKEIAARVETRALRRGALAARQSKPDAQVLLDESLLLRTMGQPQMLGRQLAHLLDAIKDGWVTARIMPFTHANPGIGNWEIFYLGTLKVEDAVLYRENSTKDEITDDVPGLSRHLSQWDKMWHGSLDENLSKKMIETRVLALLDPETPPG